MGCRTTCLLLCLALLSGCATKPRFPVLPRGDSLAVSVAMRPQAESVGEIHNEAIRDTAVAGAGGGMGVGALWGLTCGPLAVLCVPLAMSAGVVTGAATGAALGSATGWLSEDSVSRLRERLNRMQQSHDLPAELGRHVADRARVHWNLDSAQPNEFVSIELQSPQLSATGFRQVRCTVQAFVTVRPSGESLQTAPQLKTYRYVGNSTSLTAWLDETSDVADRTFTAAMEQIATQVVNDLARE